MSEPKRRASWPEDDPEPNHPSRSGTENLSHGAMVSGGTSETTPAQIQDLMETVYKAAGAGEAQTISRVLSGQREDVIRQVLHVHSPYSWSPLMVAVQHGHILVVGYFLQGRGKRVFEYDNVNQEVPDMTALTLAAKHGHENIVQLLLEREADVNQTDKRLRTALHEACRHGHLDIVERLLHSGARTDVADAKNNTCLMTACACDQAKVVELLLKAGVDPNQKSPDDRTALHVAAQRGALAAAQELLKSPDLVSTKSQGRSALIQALLSNSNDVAELLMDSPVMTRQEKYEAKKLMGAFCIEDGKLGYGYLVWKEAMKEKLQNPTENLSVGSRFPAPDLLGIGESQTWTDLESRISSNWRMMIESLVIFESILGHDNDLIRSTYLDVCKALCESRQYSEALKVWTRGWKALVGVSKVQGFHDCLVEIMKTSTTSLNATQTPWTQR